MNGFKILKNPNKPTTKHMRAKCCKAHMEFIIRLEHGKGGWCMVYAYNSDGNSSSGTARNINGELQFNDGLYVGNDYACPHCGNKSIVRCGNCGQISCNDGGKYFRCEYCGNSSEIIGKMTAAYIEQPSQDSKK